jgi:5'-nucleotidase
LTYHLKDGNIPSVKRPHLLLTNDDGVMAEGLKRLRNFLSKTAKVTVVVPDRERSASSHSLTLNNPIRVDKIEDDFYVTTGTPADCVNLAIYGLLDEVPDIVISGINSSPNLGDDVIYSGTVSAAMEGLLLGFPSFAISIESNRPPIRYETACRVAKGLVDIILKRGLPPSTFLNINIPNLEPDRIKGVAITKLGRRLRQEKLHKRLDPRGRVYYWMGTKGYESENEEGTDFSAIKSSKISITPLHIDLTNHKAIDFLEKWDWEGLI